MLSYNGTDYTLVLTAVAFAVLLAAAEYILCAKVRNKYIKMIPLVVPVFFLVLIPFCLTGETGGFIDLRGLVAFICGVCAVISAAAIGIGWLIYKVKSR